MSDWGDRLRSGSFRGVSFKVEISGRLGGCRAALFEFPKRDTPYTEGMGRRAKRFGMTCYVIGSDSASASRQWAAVPTTMCSGRCQSPGVT